MGILYEVCLPKPQYTGHASNTVSSIPPGVLVLVLLFISLPASFPYQSDVSQSMFTSFGMAAVQKLDFLGAFLLLAASVLFVSALEEGGTEYSWRSAVVLSQFCISILLWILFFAWQKVASGPHIAREPMLPWRLLTNRITLGFLL